MEAINLNLIPSGVLPVCHAKQFDKFGVMLGLIVAEFINTYRRGGGV